MKPESSLIIRCAQESEAAELSALAVAAKRHWSYSDAQIEAWRADLEVTSADISDGILFVAERSGRAAGFYVLVESPSRWLLDDLWVLPAFSRQGIGRALLEHAKQTAVAGGAAEIAIDADPNAEGFYLACGARRIGEVAAPIDGDRTRVRPQMLLALYRS
ncbi:MAG: GNAT family N-acetyltransferase [Betaproteobacteria bacterium]|nr:GNAT family N-acetyltransferase [Betaproteobacteria bacterium]